MIFPLLDNFKNIVNKNITKQFPLRLFWINANLQISYFLNQNLFLSNDNLIRFDNGYWGLLTPDHRLFPEKAKRLIEFYEWLKSKNIDYAYILCPSKLISNEVNCISLPKGLKDYSNENANAFLDTLRKTNVPILDLRKELINDYADPFSAFFKTDHHWKPETGLWATDKILNFFNKKFGHKIDTSILDSKRFTFKNYEKVFIGSEGIKVGTVLPQKENFSLIMPCKKFDCVYEAYFLTAPVISDVKREGDFVEVVYDKSIIDEKKWEDLYNIYLGKCAIFSRFINKSCKKGKRLLIIRDSYSQVVIPFLGLVYNEIVLIDPRKFPNNISIKKIVSNYKPDLVVCMFTQFSNSFAAAFENDVL